MRRYRRSTSAGFRANKRATSPLVAITITAAVLLSLFGFVGPSDATTKPHQRETVDFELTGAICETEIISKRTRRNGTTIVRSNADGVTNSSVALMTGDLEVRSRVVTTAKGSVYASGSWTLQPSASTGSIRGYLRTKKIDGDVQVLLKGWGRGALRGVRVNLTASLPQVGEDNGLCPADAAETAGFAGSGTATVPMVDNPVGAVVIEGTKSFDSAVADLTAAINNNPNLGLLATVNHQAGAESRGLTLPPTTELFFGNPRIGTPLMQAAQETGIDLPQKILIWEDLVGTVRVAYNAPSYLQSRHGLEGVDPQLQTVAGALANLAAVAAGTTPEPVFDAGEVREDRGLVTLQSDRSVDETFAAIVTALTDAPPINVVFELEHDQNAARVDLELRPTKLVVFGNPSLGTKLMQTEQSVALDLPQKILVFEDADGQTIVAYNDPDYVARRHGVRGQSEVLDIISGALANFAGR